MVRELDMKDDLSDDLRNEEEQHHRPDKPARHQFEFLPETEILLLPAKTNQPHSFVQRTFYALWIFGHRFLIHMSHLRARIHMRSTRSLSSLAGSNRNRCYGPSRSSTK